MIRKGRFINRRKAIIIKQRLHKSGVQGGECCLPVFSVIVLAEQVAVSGLEARLSRANNAGIGFELTPFFVNIEFVLYARVRTHGAVADSEW